MLLCQQPTQQSLCETMARGLQVSPENAQLTERLSEDRGQIARRPVMPPLTGSELTVSCQQWQKSVAHQCVEPRARQSTSTNGATPRFAQPGETELAPD